MLAAEASIDDRHKRIQPQDLHVQEGGLIRIQYGAYMHKAVVLTTGDSPIQSRPETMHAHRIEHHMRFNYSGRYEGLGTGCIN